MRVYRWEQLILVDTRSSISLCLSLSIIVLHAEDVKGCQASLSLLTDPKFFVSVRIFEPWPILGNSSDV